MAARRRRTAKRRRPVRRRKRKTLKIKVEPAIAREIWAIIYFSVGVLTIMSIQGAFGIIGDTWVNFLSPILGWGIYIIPGVFLLISAMLFFSKKLQFGAARDVGLFLFMISILSILHLSVPVEDIYEFAVQGSHGGYIGFVTNFLLLEVLSVGEVGAAVVFVAMFLVSLLLVFEVSLREIVRFVVPEIKIEMLKNKAKKDKKVKKEHESEGAVEFQPEIMIHKSRISKKNVDNVIYEEDEDDKEEEEKSEKPEQKTPGLASTSKDSDPSINTHDDKSDQKQTSFLDEDYEWEFPSLDLLKTGDSNVEIDEKVLMLNAKKIKEKLSQFGIEVVMHEVNVGPTVIQYTLKPDDGVKLSKITSLKNDLALAIAAERIRIEAPIPGKSLVGIEVPNSYRAVVCLKEILESSQFADASSKLILPLGRDVTGKPVVANLETMPHLLIAGATGSGKSVGLNSFLISLLYQNSPRDLRFIMVDPKRVELSAYNSIPHLLCPVIENPEKAATSLKWVVSEMNRRYAELSSFRVRNIFEFNELEESENFSRIIVVIDELADLMMVSGKEVEATICRIAQMARAVGIHLIIATQRPSVDVITGLIKANIPSRIAFAVTSSIDSRTILDGIGAEDLLGRGDMLYLPTGQNKPVRVQGIFVSTEEVQRVSNRIRLTIEPDYNENITSVETANKDVEGVALSKKSGSSGAGDGKKDKLYEEALALVQETRKASASLFQRRLKIGYARAARIIDQLEDSGVVGPADGAKARKILL
ncbi:DNA translocase FtsK 4TM domain-containing protein [Patescibacteria group bacterium]